MSEVPEINKAPWRRSRWNPNNWHAEPGVVLATILFYGLIGVGIYSCAAEKAKPAPTPAQEFAQDVASDSWMSTIDGSSLELDPDTYAAKIIGADGTTLKQGKWSSTDETATIDPLGGTFTIIRNGDLAFLVPGSPDTAPLSKCFFRLEYDEDPPERY